MKTLGIVLVLACLAIVIVVGGSARRYDDLERWWRERERERER